jgi:hypothetical protein
MTQIDHNFTGTAIIRGDTLSVLKTFPDALFGGIVTDPPYASGAADQNARQKSTAQKYCSVKSGKPLPDFEGDSKDQRSWTRWMTEWLTEARRVTMPGAPICLFIDWRQLPNMTDALQWAGWLWRGILVWDKTNSRPQHGRFRQQAEFVVSLLGEGRRDGILVNAEGASYARYSAFLPGAASLYARANALKEMGKDFAEWKTLTEQNPDPWREDARYRKHKDGALYYIGGEDGQYMRIAKDGRLVIGTYELARPGIADAVLLNRAVRQYESYEQALPSASRLAGQRFMSDIFHEKPSVLDKIRETRNAPPAPRKQRDGRGKDGAEL